MGLVVDFSELRGVGKSSAKEDRLGKQKALNNTDKRQLLRKVCTIVSDER
jgi:hypothetical protein